MGSSAAHMYPDERQQFLDATKVKPELLFDSNRERAIEVVVAIMLTWQAQNHGLLASTRIDHPGLEHR